MSAESIVYALLSGAAAVTAVVSTRVYPVELPEGVALPAIVYDVVSNVRAGRIDAAAASHPTTARVQVTMLVESHSQLMTLRAAVIAALQFQRGSIGGSTVVSILKGPDGPTDFDEAMAVFAQPVDFLVTFLE